MKKFIAGFLAGALLFSMVPISAAIEEYICYKASYKVMINGVEYTEQNIPILNYNGYTYYPKTVLEKAGLNVIWNTLLNQDEITSNPTSAQINEVEVNTMKTTIEYDPVTGLPVGAEYVVCERDGKEYRTIAYNGKTYISGSDLNRFYDIEYVGNGVLTNKLTKKSAAINFVFDTIAIKAVVYYDSGLLIEIMGD